MNNEKDLLQEINTIVNEIQWILDELEELESKVLEKERLLEKLELDYNKIEEQLKALDPNYVPVEIAWTLASLDDEEGEE